MNFSKKKNSIFSAAAAFLSTVALWLHFRLSPSDYLIIFVYAAFIALFGYSAGIKNRRGLAGAAVTGAVFALFTVLSRLDIMSGRQSWPIFAALRFVGFALLYTAALNIAFDFADRKLSTMLDKPREKKSLPVFFACWAVLYLWFFLWLLYRYPGGVTIDSNLQLLQAMGKEPLSNHHPIIHTAIIKVLFDLGLQLSGGDQNFAVALYNGVQALMLSGCFAWLIESMYRQGVKKYVLFTVLAVYIVLPYHGAYSVTMWKDVWFGAVVLLLCVSLWRMICAVRLGEKFGTVDMAVFFVSSLLMCLFRSNGLYAYVLFLPFVTLFILCSARKWAAALPVLALVLAFLVKGPLYGSLGITPPDTIESLSIPAQHIARAVRDGAELDDKQYELLSQAVDVEALARVYSPQLSDPVKELIRHRGDQQFIAENKAEFLRLWLELGLENPGSYLKAQLDQTQGYWDPAVQHWVLAPDFTLSYEMELEADCKLPEALASLADKALELIPKLPFVSMIFSIGAGVWVFLALLALCLVRRRYLEALVFIPHLAIWGTLLIATPVHAEFRYIYSLFTTLPLLGILPFSHVNCNKAKESA